MATILDLKNIRKKRQYQNNNVIIDIIEKNSKDVSNCITKIKKVCNEEAFKRYVDYLELSEEEIITKCIEDNIFRKSTAMYISKNSSRQGTKDEDLVLETCNNISKKYDVNISKLGINEYVLGYEDSDKKKFKICKRGLENIKEYTGTKSMDAKIEGKINGWITAKVCYTNGGHQDNVFHELETFGEICEKYGNKDELYVILIDTDLMNRLENLKNKFAKSENILVVNHVEFQEYIMNKNSKNIVTKSQVKRTKKVSKTIKIEKENEQMSNIEGENKSITPF